jgi:hypothetical protein
MTVALARSAPGREVYRGDDARRESRRPGVDPHMHCALTDLHAYVLALDAERDRLGDTALLRTTRVWREDAALAVLRAELAEESVAVRMMLTALRAEADPEGDLL